MIQQDKLSFIPSVSVNTSAAFTGMSLILIKIHDLKDSIVEFRHDMTALSCAVKKKLQEITDDPDAILLIMFTGQMSLSLLQRKVKGTEAYRGKDKDLPSPYAPHLSDCLRERTFLSD